MKPTRKIFYYALLALVVVSGFATVHAVYAQQQTTSYAIVGAKVFPISGPPIDGATVVIRDGKIASVGKGGAPAGVKVIDGKGLEVYPGLFNAATEIGLNEIGEGDPGSVDTQELGEYNAAACFRNGSESRERAHSCYARGWNHARDCRRMEWADEAEAGRSLQDKHHCSILLVGRWTK